MPINLNAIRNKLKQNRDKTGRPSAARPSTAATPSALRPQSATIKAAVLIGVEYVNYARKHRLDRLPGCHQDIASMVKILKEDYGFSSNEIRILADDNSHQSPTRANILNAVSWLKNKAQQPNCKFVYLYYSGHGIQVADKNGDEKDGKDEAIVPSDFLEKSVITDDTLGVTLLSGLRDSANVVGVFDSCNSGTLLDLPCVYNFETGKVVTRGWKKSQCNAKVITLSGCQDPQTSASVYGLGERAKKWRGAMTVCLENILKSHRYKIEYPELLQLLREELKRNGFTQIPQLCFNPGRSDPDTAAPDSVPQLPAKFFLYY